MTNNSIRILLGAGVVVVAVALFIVLSPGGDEDSSTDGGGAGSESAQAEQESGGTDTDRSRGPEEPDSPTVPTVVVENGQPVDGVADIEVQHGETAQFNVRSDVPEEVHVHGYDISEGVAPGQPARVRFTADLEGVFEVELEHSAVPIVQLTVTP